MIQPAQQQQPQVAQVTGQQQAQDLAPAVRQQLAAAGKALDDQVDAVPGAMAGQQLLARREGAVGAERGGQRQALLGSQRTELLQAAGEPLES